MLGFMVDKFGYDPLMSLPLNKALSPCSTGTLVQFDGRCSELQRRGFSLSKKMNIVSKLDDFTFIGGHETRRYLGDGFRYDTGNLNYIIKSVCGAELFVGSDSGMSHLAGAFGTKSIVYVAGNIPCVVDYYVLSYRNCSVVRFPML
jgi:hypothetical protein